MTIKEKYDTYEALYNKYFVAEINPDEKAAYIPAEYIQHSEGGVKRIFLGDAPINIANYLQYMYSRCLTGDDKARDHIENALSALERLSTFTCNYFKERNPAVHFINEPGFFFRDDVDSTKAHLFNADVVDSPFSMCMEGINDDPCLSPFVSQDQIWNLAPMLSFLSRCSDKPIADKSKQLLYNMFEYVIRNRHTLYNPYFSAIKHNWTSLIPFSVSYFSRIDYRNKRLKYDVKVKRGANNWYFAYGFRKAFEKVGGNPGKFKSFLYSLIYYPLTFVAETIYFPLFADRLKWVERKDNSYSCLATAGNVWYSGMKRFLKRALNGFYKNGQYTEVVFIEAIKQNRLADINVKQLEKYLQDYPKPTTEGVVYSPVKFLTVYNYYQYLNK